MPPENINFDVPFLKDEKCDIALILTFNFITKKKKKKKTKKELRMQEDVT